MKVKPLRWTESEVFGALKVRGFGLGGEFSAFDRRGLTNDQVAEKKAEIQARYESWALEEVSRYFE